MPGWFIPDSQGPAWCQPSGSDSESWVMS